MSRLSKTLTHNIDVKYSIETTLNILGVFNKEIANDFFASLYFHLNSHAAVIRLV